MMAFFVQTLAWSALTALPIILVAQLVGRLRVPARLKVWTCRLAFVKLLLGLLPLGFGIQATTQASQLAASQGNPRFDLLMLVLTVLWAAGFIVVIVDLMRAYRASRALLEISQPTSSDLLQKLSKQAKMKCPQVRQGQAEGLPFAAGILRPVVVIPHQPCPESVLAHELAHIRARDLIWNLAARVILGIFWFTPLIHVLEREMALWQESAADSEACRLTACPLKSHAQAIVVSATKGAPSLVWEARLSGNAQIIGRRLSALYQKPSWGIAALSLALLSVALVPIKVKAPSVKPMGPMRIKASAEFSAAAPIAGRIRY